MAGESGLPMVKIGRFCFFMCVVLQLTVFPVFPVTEEGKADRKAEPKFVSPLQVVLAVIGKQAAEENPEIISALVFPGAMAREAANFARCELKVGDCNDYPIFNWGRWKEVSSHPDYSSQGLLDALQASYPQRIQELFAGCIFTVTSALLCALCSTKMTVLGVGVSIYAAMGEGLKLAPWVGVLVSAAMLSSGLLDLKPQTKKAPATGAATDSPKEAAPAPEQKKDK